VTNPLDPSRLARLAQVAELTVEQIDFACERMADFLRRPLWDEGDDKTVEAWVKNAPWPTGNRQGFEPWLMPDITVAWPEPGYGGIVKLPAWPISSVSDPADGQIVNSARAVFVGTPVGYPITVTYRGGWTADTVPFMIEVAIAHLAAADTPDSAEGLPVGVTSVRLGDAAIGLDPALVAAKAGPAVDLDGLVPGIERKIKRWRFQP
jgi:hypothetical protein